MNAVFMVVNRKIKIEQEPLEITNGKMEFGKAYLYMRGDDSFMLHSNRENYGGRWFGQDWFDFGRNFLHTHTTTTCSLDIVKMNRGVDYDHREFISGTYAINDDTCWLLSDAMFKAFSIIAPIVEDIERNISNYSFNKQQRFKEKRVTYIDKEADEIDMEPGTVVLSRCYETGMITISRIKNRKTTIGSPCPTVREYSSDTFCVNFKNDMKLAHYIDYNYIGISNDARVEIDKDFKNIDKYLIPRDVFENFNKKYIAAVDEVQNLRTDVLNVVLANHEAKYGVEFRNKAEENVNRWLKNEN